MLKGNKGEWSEPYTLLKLISDRKLHLGDLDLKKVDDKFYPILNLIKNEKDGKIEFSYDDSIVIITNQANVFKIRTDEFLLNAKKCFDAIKIGKGSFEIPDVASFLNSISINKLKAKSKDKNDITITIEDSKTFVSPSLGFSIKSQLGSPSTLVNASVPTNFTFELSDNSLKETEIKEINNTEEFSKKIALLKSKGIELKYVEVENRIFKSNLSIFGKDFDVVLAEMLVLFYSNSVASENRVSKFIKKIAVRNPVGHDLEINPDLYEIAMKQFLIDYSLGMRAAEVWKKQYQASGGYIIVKKDGDIICYHFYFIKEFGDYLMNNTMLETGSTTKHKFGKIYKNENRLFLKLNLQIRFIK